MSTVEETSFDGVIIGAGHNGLIAAAYLAKAGLKVGVFEFRPNVGGGFATEELTAPGFRHNIHAIYCKLHDSPVHGDLELEKYGAGYVFPEVKHAFVDHDRYQAFYQGIKRNYESISRISAKDAATYLDVAEKWNRWYLDFILPEMYSAPKSRDQFEDDIRKKPGGDEYLKVIYDYTPMEYAASLFETDVCRWYLIRCCLYAEYSPFSKGIPAIVFAHLVNHYAGNTALMRGGTRYFADAVARCVEDQGGHIFLNQPVEKILVENGASTGVVLQNGREIRAKQFVISTIDPVHTFLFMIDERDLPKETVERASAFKFSGQSLFRVHLALSEAPRFTILESAPEVNNASKFTIGFGSLDGFLEMGAQSRRGEIPELTGLDGGVISVSDPTQAPEGGVSAYIGLRVPFELADGGANAWATVGNQLAKRCFEKLREWAPNMTEDKILGMFAYTPKDIEEYLPDMVSADIAQGDISTDQLGDARPWPGMSNYRTPIERLYLGGSATHPGGFATGANGYNVANAVVEDLKLEKKWAPYDPYKVVGHPDA